MREDARNFLDNQSKSNFQYREFENRFYVNSTWTMFSAILHDGRVFGDCIAMAPAAVDGKKSSEPILPQESPSAGPLLERYGMPVAPSVAQRGEVDLREFFSRFSESE